MKLLWILLFFPLLSQASSGLEDAFSAYVQVKKWEEKLATLSVRVEMGEGERAALQKEWSAKLSEARIQFHAFKKENAEMEEWEWNLIAALQDGKKIEASTAQAMPFLEGAFPDAKNFSPLEWEAVGDCFGKTAQTAFFEKVFPFKALALQETSPRPVKILWVMDPFRKTNPIPENKIPAKWEKSVQKVEISAFGKVEEQAEELHLRLQMEEPVVLVSFGNASAVVHKMLDLYPAIRASNFILGWVNLNGNLYGLKMESKSSRGLASVKKPEMVAAKDALRGLYLQRLEAQERGAPLGQGFPIFNLVGGGKAANREAIVPEGTNFAIGSGSPWDYVQAVTQQILPPAPADET